MTANTPANVAIDRQSPLPMYHQLKEILLARIQSEPLAPGSSFPSEMELIETYEVSRTTVRQAIAELGKQGFLYTIKGTLQRNSVVTIDVPDCHMMNNPRHDDH